MPLPPSSDIVVNWTGPDSFVSHTMMLSSPVEVGGSILDIRSTVAPGPFSDVGTGEVHGHILICTSSSTPISCIADPTSIAKLDVLIDINPPRRDAPIIINNSTAGIDWHNVFTTKTSDPEVIEYKTCGFHDCTVWGQGGKKIRIPRRAAFPSGLLLGIRLITPPPFIFEPFTDYRLDIDHPDSMPFHGLAGDKFVFSSPSPVPIPGAVWLMGSGLVFIGIIRRRKGASPKA